jgi:hypothetical protein
MVHSKRRSHTTSLLPSISTIKGGLFKPEWITSLIAMPAVHAGRNRNLAIEQNGDYRSERSCLEDEMVDSVQTTVILKRKYPILI